MDTNEIRAILKQFFRVNHTTNAVRIDFDSMCAFLIKDCKRSFSPSKLERVMEPELKKLEGLPICPEMFDELAKYVDDMTKYIEQQAAIAGQGREQKVIEKLKKFKELKKLKKT